MCGTPETPGAIGSVTRCQLRPAVHADEDARVGAPGDEDIGIARIEGHQRRLRIAVEAGEHGGASLVLVLERAVAGHERSSAGIGFQFAPPSSDITMRGPPTGRSCDAMIRCGLLRSTANTPNPPPPAGIGTCCHVPPAAVPWWSHTAPCASPLHPPLFTKKFGVPPANATCSPQGAPGEFPAPSCVQTTGDAPTLSVANTPDVVATR